MAYRLTVEDLNGWAARSFPRLLRECFDLAGAGVEVVAAQPIVDYVAWYVDGYFARRAAPDRTRLIVYSSAPELFRIAREAPLASSIRRAVLPTAPDVVCLVDDARSTVHLVLGEGAEHEHAQVVVRIMRALILRELLAKGELFVRAACFALEGEGVAVLGGRAAGKTTMLLHTLDSAGGALAGNDKVALRQGGEGQVEVAGFPIRVGVRAGSVLSLREGPLRDYLVHQWEQQIGDVEGCGDALEPRLALRPQELATAAGSTVAPRGRLTVAIEPRLDPAVSAPYLSLLSEEEAGALWSRNVLHGPGEVFPEQAALADGAPEHRQWIPQIPTYRLIQPPGMTPQALRLVDDVVRRTREGE
ncbi:hypothetical protein [Salinactinospora qingdaonensis]|uniref:Uncharacterized protein n=1 Tax=Salinactinospora qingdaonensis TaxID=702744 RepID=A0ABP7FV69_9ACTN